MTIGPLICVDPDKVGTIFPHVAAMIDAAYAAIDEVTPDVGTWLAEKRGLLWIEVDVDMQIIICVTTSLVPMRSGLACRMVAAGGKPDSSWQSYVGQIEEYARAEGCYKVICDGRPGWSRALPGYRTKSVSLEKRI